jgi:hypothetical protein
MSKSKFNWSKDFYGAAVNFIYENTENISHVQTVLDSIENLKNVLHNKEKYLRIMDTKDGAELDREVYLNVGDNAWELVGQVALDKNGDAIDDGSAWYDVNDFDDIIRKYSEELEQDVLKEEDGGEAIGSEITSGEGPYEPLSVRGYTTWSTKKQKIKKGKLSSKGGNKYKVY